MTSSPGPMPKSLRIISAPAVCELTQATLGTPIYSARLFSNCFVTDPVVIQPDRKTSETASMSCSEISGLLNEIYICPPVSAY